MVASDEELGNFEEAYLGHWESLTDYAESLLDEFGLDRQIDAAIPEPLRGYVKVDAEGFGRDLDLGGDITTVEGDGGIYVFRSH